MRFLGGFLAVSCALVGCGKDSTAPPPPPVSVMSYISEVPGATYIPAQPIPRAGGSGLIQVVRGDTSLGRGSTFSLLLNHPPGLKAILVGAEGTLGYFQLPVPETATQTSVRGRVSAGAMGDFVFLCGAVTTRDSSLAPVAHPVRVLSQESVLYYLTKVESADGQQASYVHAALPTPTKGQTFSQVEADSFVVNGGSMEVSATCLVPATAVLVGVPQAYGYFRLPTTGLPGPITLVLAVAQSAQTDFTVVLMSEEPGGQFGTALRLRAGVIRVGSGELQVSLAFRPSQDLDLHLVEPTGEEIYYANRTSSSGGELDLDSNAACRLDHKNNENITYQRGSPPRGEYIVRVDFWASCDGGGATYRVVVAVRGEVQMYRGSFEPSEADRGGLGSGREVCRFTF